MQNKYIKVFKYLLGWPISLIALFFIFKIILPKISVIKSNLININIFTLLLGVSLFVSYYFVRGYIWYRLVKINSTKITYKQSAYFWAISELKRYIPGSVISFLGRAILFSDLGIKKKDVGKLLIVEAIIFVLGSLFASLLALPFLSQYFLNGLNYELILYASVSLLIIFVCLFIYKLPKYLPEYKLSEKVFFVCLSSCGLFFFGLGNYFTISSIVTLPIQSVFQLSGFFILALVAGYLSILTPAGFGVREGVVIAGLSKVITLSESALSSILSRVVLIISELIFVFICYLFYKVKNKKILQIEIWIGENKQFSILFLLIFAYILYFSTVSFLRYENFYAGRFDLGNMAQTAWNTSHGRIFMFTNPNGTSMISRLAFHADFLLIFLAPFYALFPDPRTILLIQTVAVSLGCVFIYKIAEEKLNNKNIALGLGFSYLLNPSVQRANLYDFHSVTLGTTFLLGMYYFYNKKKYNYFLLFAILSAFTKEQIWIIVALFGGLIFFNHKKRLFGGAIFIFSAGMFYYLVSIAIPHALGSSHFALSYYSDLGSSPSAVIKNLILSPQKILAIIFQPDKVNYLNQLFSPVGYLPILFPFFLFFAIPELLLNLLSNNAQLYQIYYHYTAAISPFISICTIYGIKNIKKYMPNFKESFIVIYILIAALLAAYRFGPLPGAEGANLDMFTRKAQNKEFITDYISRIPQDLSIASSNNIGSHFSQRQRIYTLPLGIDQADVIVFLLDDSESQVSIEQEKSQLREIRNNDNYKLEVEKGSFVVFKRKNI